MEIRLRLKRDSDNSEPGHLSIFFDAQKDASFFNVVQINLDDGRILQVEREDLIQVLKLLVC